nr:hypothetical protein [Tanacetum cinerariifolium]
MSSYEASSGVTYTSISSDYNELSDVGSPGVVVYGYDGLPMHPANPPSPNYVFGPEEPKQAPLSPDYVPGTEYPEYLAPSDKEVSIKDQPYAVVDSPIALSSGYIANSDLEEDSKDGPVDYPTDGGDDDDDDSFDDDDDEEEALKEEEDHWLRLTLSLHPLLIMSPLFRRQSRLRPMSLRLHHHHHLQAVPLSVRPQAPMPSLSEAEVKRLLALPTPPPSPLILLPPPSADEHFARCLAAPALPSSLYLPPPVPTSLPPSLPPLPASLFIPPPIDRREDVPEAELPPHKRLCLTAPTSRYEVKESLTTAARPTEGHRVDYGFIDTLDAETRRQRAEKVGYGIRDVWVDPTEAVEEKTMLLMEQEALVSREAWAQSVGLSLAVHQELQAFKTYT